MGDDRTRSVVPRAADASKGLRLIVFVGGQVTSHALPQAGEVVIGRGDDAGVRIDHATVSRRHATLLLGGEVRIVDHGSFNGTSMGGKKVPPNTPVPVGLSTIVELGETMIVVQVEGAAPVTASRSLGQSQAPRADISPGMQHLYRLVDNVAQSNITVIVRGETGSGKEVVSEEIHKRSARANGPLVKLNCAALPEHLLEGELFGYERGAFTGANQAKGGPHRVGGRRHALSRRGRRDAARHAGEASSRGREPRGDEARQPPPEDGRRALRRRHAPRSRGRWSRADSFVRTSTTGWRA